MARDSIYLTPQERLARELQEATTEYRQKARAALDRYLAAHVSETFGEALDADPGAAEPQGGPPA